MLEDLRRTLLARYGTTDVDAVRRTGERIVVPVRFHVVAAGTEGLLSRARIEGQVAALNRAYTGATGGADTGLSFRLAGSDTTVNAAWFSAPQENETAMKRALRRGGPGTLNLYTAAVGADVLGFSTFPQWQRRQPVADGVVVDYRTLPGGSYRHFDRGYTAVHEVGHWLGLLHTFENGCQDPGDGIADTPDEAEPTQGCPASKDTCWKEGDDPVHNFMDYGWDDCMREFTPGQGARVRAVWAAYRSGQT